VQEKIQNDNEDEINGANFEKWQGVRTPEVAV
jgi:hypothetical protein